MQSLKLKAQEQVLGRTKTLNEKFLWEGFTSAEVQASKTPMAIIDSLAKQLTRFSQSLSEAFQDQWILILLAFSSKIIFNFVGMIFSCYW